jgi:hypothetical protein
MKVCARKRCSVPWSGGRCTTISMTRLHSQTTRDTDCRPPSSRATWPMHASRAGARLRRRPHQRSAHVASRSAALRRRPRQRQHRRARQWAVREMTEERLVILNPLRYQDHRPVGLPACDADGTRRAKAP